MSDFVNNFWSIYIAVIAIVGIFGCLLLLILTARKKVDSAADNTTGHVWDGDLRELNNPMPRLSFPFSILLPIQVWGRFLVNSNGRKSVLMKPRCKKLKPIWPPCTLALPR